MIIHGKGEEEYCVDIKAQMNTVLMTDYMHRKYKELLQQERDKRNTPRVIPEHLRWNPIISQNDPRIKDM